MSLNIAMAEDVPKAENRRRHLAVVSDLFFDAESGMFSGAVRHSSGSSLLMTTPIQLEPELRAVKILASTIPGWLFGAEMDILFKMAQEVKTNHAVVEIGSYCGRSTVCLGWGVRLGNQALLYAVDPHTGSAEHQDIMRGTLGSLPYFKASVQRANLQDWTIPLVMTSEEAVAFVQEPVGLLFIDGDHEMTHRDLELWYDKIVPGGMILFHDSVGGAWPQVEIDVQTAVSAGLIQVLEQTCTITITQKVRKQR